MGKPPPFTVAVPHMATSPKKIMYMNRAAFCPGDDDQVLTDIYQISTIGMDLVMVERPKLRPCYLYGQIW
jgi:hypothetical protein